MTWMPLSLGRSPAKAHLLTTRKLEALLPAAAVRSIKLDRRRRVQLDGKVSGTPILFCRASLALAVLRLSDGVLLPVFTLQSNQKGRDAVPTNKNRPLAVTPEACFESL
ncbi:MAG: hypothetical protein HFJ80_06535 [Clostridiales bacterium]|nr:hypothetical protein [Clostridiales bacterium]